ncbi:MAG: DNA gyrase subunit A [Planctomycetes bacterium]|nr:DNA gyrase subunit A [Planctomycetota bacterium]
MSSANVPSPDPPSTLGLVIDKTIDRELHESYLVYAMSTIMDRALPDVRDGLKPSQRRILVAMNDLNLTPGRKQIKCAKICGDTSGNYHPHGESVIYPTLVNLGQAWKTRALLVDKQGNFGSIEGDPPAAMRYTEARMTGVAVAMLEDLDKGTVDFRPNYDDRLMEPTVLPGKFPNLLVNGSSGIAVGMASSMAPHNLTEIANAIAATIDNPSIGLEGLMAIVQGPDFPTGGTIVGRRGIIEAYATGRGRLTVRGKVRHETRDGRAVLVIEEIPYQVVQSALIEKIVEAKKEDRIPDIADVRNHSGRDAQTRILVVLRKGADPAVVERQLYEFTPLQTTYSIMNITLVNGQPRTLPFTSLIGCYIDHRRDVIRRRTEFLLRQARQQAHKLEGLVYAVCDIDAVIAIIRGSRTREEAIEALLARAFRIAPDHPNAPLVPQRIAEASRRGDGARLTRVQAEAIGALRLIQLVGLEIERLAREFTELLAEIDRLEALLADDRLILQIIRSDVLQLAERFGDARRTTIEVGEADDFNLAELIQEHDVAVTVSHQGFVKRLPVDTFRTQGRGGVGIRGSDAKDGDYIERVFIASTHDDLLCFTNTGRVYRTKVWQIPEMSRTSKGRSVQNVIELKAGECVVAYLPIRDFEAREDYLFFATANGRVKRSSLKDYRNVHRSGIIAVRLNEGDRLVNVVETSGQDHILLATAEGMAIRFDENDARVMGRDTAGVSGVDLADGDELVGLVRCDDTAQLFTCTEHGFGKRTDMTEYLVHQDDGQTRAQSRGGKGRIDIKTDERNGRVVAVHSIHEDDDLMFVSKGGMVVRIRAADVRIVGRNTLGVRVVKLQDDDALVGAARFDRTDEPAPDANAVPEGAPVDPHAVGSPAPKTDGPSAAGT